MRLCWHCTFIFIHFTVNGVEKTPNIGDVRLWGGRTTEEGNVEIFYNGEWGLVCDDDWDIADSNVVCTQLGLNTASGFTTDSYFGRGPDVVWLDNVRCNGHESQLSSCHHDGWGEHDCNSMEAAGVVCKPNQSITPLPQSKPNSTDNQPTISDIFDGKSIVIALKHGRTRQEGRVEFESPERGLICGVGWSLREGMVLCRDLGLGYAQQAVQGTQFGPSDHRSPFLLYSVQCNGDELHFSLCKASPINHSNSNCSDGWAAGVVCSEELPDLLLDLELVRDSVYLHDQSLHYLQCAMEEKCLASSAGGVIRRPDWYYRTRRLLRFSTKVYNVGNADFLPFVIKSQWQWHQCHMHYHSMEVFSHYDIIHPITQKKVAEGHKASFCLEDTDCEDGIRRRYRCANYGDQGISPGCWDTYLHDIDCQWIDISDLGPGYYIFKVTVNPEYKVAEKNFSNNGVVCDLYYNRVQAVVSNCVHSTP